MKGVEQILGKDALKEKVSYTASNTNVAPAIGKLQAAKCDVVFAFAIPPLHGAGAGHRGQLGYKTQWVVSNVGADPTALKAT